MKYQTAVDFLIEELLGLDLKAINGGLPLEDYDNLKNKIKVVAKELEKKQVVKAWQDGANNKWASENTIINGNQYYEENYKICKEKTQ